MAVTSLQLTIRSHQHISILFPNLFILEYSINTYYTVARPLMLIPDETVRATPSFEMDIFFLYHEHLISDMGLHVPHPLHTSPRS